MKIKQWLAKKVYGADFEIAYRKSEIRNNQILINDTKRKIRKLKRKFPYRQWLGEARPYKRDIEFYEKSKREHQIKLKEWQRIRALMKSQKLRKVI